MHIASFRPRVANVVISMYVVDCYVYIRKLRIIKTDSPVGMEYFVYFCNPKKQGVLAHLVERLVRNQQVTGSTPVYSTYEEVAIAASFFIIRQMLKSRCRNLSDF